ncbi:MAG: porin family protein [Agarilytica sp.]
MRQVTVVLIALTLAASSIAEKNISTEVLLGYADNTTAASSSGVLFGESFADSFSQSDDSNSYGLRVSYNFTNSFAAELSYHDYGEAEYSYIDDFGDQINDKVNTGSINVGIKGFLPISEYVDLTCRLGMSRWDLESKSTDSSIPGEVFSFQKKDKDIYYSVGVDYDFGENIFFGLEYSVLKMNWGESFSDESFSSSSDIEHEVKNISLSIGMKY